MSAPTAAPSRADATTGIVPVLWALVRVLIGWVFLWTFIDKLVGAGLDTKEGWIDGASPTRGFLSFGVNNAVGRFYSDLAGGGGGWIDWVYMLSMLAIGLGLIFGVLTRIAALGGILWLAMFYTATFTPDRNPVVDQHIAYIALLIGVIIAGAGETLGLSRLVSSRWPRGRAPYWLAG